jgi:hypothetical protein
VTKPVSSESAGHKGKENDTDSVAPASKVPLLRRASAPLLKLALGAAAKAKGKKKAKGVQFLATRAGSAPCLVQAKGTVGGSAPSTVKGKGKSMSAASAAPATDESFRWEPGLHMVMARKRGAGFARSFSLKGGTPRKARKMADTAADATADTAGQPQSDGSRRRSSLRSSAQLQSVHEHATTAEQDESDGEWF